MSMNISVSIRDLLSVRVRFRLLVILIIIYTSQKSVDSTMEIDFLMVITLYRCLSFAEPK